MWPHSSSKNTALLTGSSSSTLGGVARSPETLHLNSSTRELSVSSESKAPSSRHPRPFSGSRYKYLGDHCTDHHTTCGRVRKELTEESEECGRSEEGVRLFESLVDACGEGVVGAPVPSLLCRPFM